VLEDISFSVAGGVILAVVGPSGAAKTTLSRCVSFLERPSSGTVRVDGKDFTRLEGAELLKARHSVGVIQRPLRDGESTTQDRQAPGLCKPLTSRPVATPTPSAASTRG
jgi:ABC-type oligopeptide transport system ATPase subunit